MRLGMRLHDGDFYEKVASDAIANEVRPSHILHCCLVKPDCLIILFKVLGLNVIFPCLATHT